MNKWSAINGSTDTVPRPPKKQKSMRPRGAPEEDDDDDEEVLDLNSPDQIREFWLYDEGGGKDRLITKTRNLDDLIRRGGANPKKVYVAYEVAGKEHLEASLWYCLVADGAADILFKYYTQTRFQNTHLKNKPVQQRGCDSLKKYMEDKAGLESLGKYIGDQLRQLGENEIDMDAAIPMLQLDFDNFFAFSCS